MTRYLLPASLVILAALSGCAGREPAELSPGRKAASRATRPIGSAQCLAIAEATAEALQAAGTPARVVLCPRTRYHRPHALVVAQTSRGAWVLDSSPGWTIARECREGDDPCRIYYDRPRR